MCGVADGKYFPEQNGQTKLIRNYYMAFGNLVPFLHRF